MDTKFLVWIIIAILTLLLIIYFMTNLDFNILSGIF